jgi:lysocardiolipin and lysophospholipid acyltransferase
MHLRLHNDLSAIPSLPSPVHGTNTSPEKGSAVQPQQMATPEEARAFELWLRGVWKEKDERLQGFVRAQAFEGEAEVVPVRQT